MKTKQVFKKLAAIGTICLLGATVFLAGCGVDEEIHNKALADLADVEAKALALEEAKAQLEEGKALSDEQVASLEQEKEALNADLESYKLEISEKDAEIAAFNAEVAAEEASYKIDELELGAEFDKILTEKELDLVDGEVEFDDEDYEVEEFVFVAGKIAINEEDFKENAYLQLAEGSVQYFVQFEDSLDVSEISSDDPLEFSFLGEDVKIVSWDEGEVEFSSGVEYYVVEGGSIPLAGEVQLEMSVVLDEAVVIKIGDVSEKINLGDVEEVNGYEVRVNEIDYQAYAGGIHAAEIDVGEEVKVVIEDGDEFNEDEKWEFFMGDHILGVKLVEEFMEVDEDEDYQALAYGEELKLPKDFAVMSFEPLSEEVYHKYTFELEEKDGDDYIEVKGDFVFGLEDYEKLYVKADGIYDEDLELLDGDVALDDVDFNLEIGEGVLSIGEFSLALDFSAVEVDGVDVSGSDEKVLGIYGFVVDEVEDSIEDEKISVEFPEEAIEATVKLMK